MVNPDNTKGSRKSSKKTDTQKETSQANAKKVEVSEAVKMCVLPEENLRAVYDWLESDQMTMPHNQVMKCLQLLGVAQILVDKN